MVKRIMDKFEITYESGAAGSFLVISADKDEHILSYQVEMIANNPDKNILPVDIRQKNEKFNLYYTITSKLKLSQYLKRNKIKRYDFIKIFSGIVKAIIDSKDFLLSDKSFLLDEEYIYINPLTAEVSLVYLPVNFDLDINNKLKEFALNFIMYSANIDETQSDNFLPRVLNFLKSETFNVLEFDKLLKELGRSSVNKEDVADDKQDINEHSSDGALKPGMSGEEGQRESFFAKSNVETPEHQKARRVEPPKPGIARLEVPRPAIQKSETQKPYVQNTAVQNSAVEKPEVRKPEVKPEIKKPPVQKTETKRPSATREPVVATGNVMKYKNNTIIVGIVIQAVLIIAAAIVLFSGIMEPLGNSMAVNAVGVMVILGAPSYFLWKKVLDRNNMVESTPVIATTARGTYERDEKPHVNMAKREIRNAPMESVTPPQNPPSSERQANVSNPEVKNPEISSRNKWSNSNPETLNETTVLSAVNLNDTVMLGVSQARYPYLQGKKDGTVEEITINKPSFVIGRLKEQVDYVSQNVAVGKVHAEIISKDGCYYIKDLNSRNGTYVNDVRLESNKEYEIKNNDKIVFANSEYTFIAL